MNSRATWSTRLLQFVIAVAIVCTGIVAHAQSASFPLLQPTPAPTWLNSIQSVGGALYGVGEQNTLVKSLDGGQTWTTQRADANAMTSFRSLSFVSGTRGWAAGGWSRIRPSDTLKYGVINWTNDGGSSWNRQIIQQATCINGIFFSSNSQGYAVGRGRDALQPFTKEKPFVYVTADNGQTWTRQTNGVPTIYGGEFKSVVFANNSTGYIIGGGIGSETMQPWINESVFGGYALYYTTNSGTNWNSANSYPEAEYYQVTPVPGSLTRVFACGNTGGTLAMFYSSDNGQNWIQQTNGFPTNLSGNLVSMVWPSANVGYAVGYKTMLVTHPTQNYQYNQKYVVIMKTVNGGNSWTELSAQFSLNDYDATVMHVTAADDNSLWICGRGDGALVLYSGDGGSTWTRRSTNLAPTNLADLTHNDVSFFDQNTGWAAGYASDNRYNGGNSYPTASYTTNAGATWSRIQISGSPAEIHGVHALTATEAWMVGWDDSLGGTLLFHTMNAGATWTRTPANLGYCYDIAFSNTNASHGVIVGSSDTYYTTDGGTTWTACNIGAYSRIGSFYGDNVWIVNSSDARHSTDGGRTWSRVSGNVISGSTWYNLSGVSFTAAGNYGWVSGWYHSDYPYNVDAPSKGGAGSATTAAATIQPLPLLAYTTDGGSTWTRQNNFQMPNPVYPCGGASPCPQYIADNQYIFNSVHDVLAVAPNAAVAVTGMDYWQTNNYDWQAGTGARLVATVDGGATWYEVDSTFQGTSYTRLTGTLTNRLDAFAIGDMGMVRHGYLQVPLIASSPDTLFKNRVLSVNPTDSADETVMIRNVGSAPLSLLNYQLSSTDLSNPQLDYTIVSSPSLLNAGDTGYVVVRFKPSIFATRFATLTISSNSVATPIITVGLRGVGGLAVVRAFPGKLFRDTVAIDGGYEDQAVYICNPGVNGVHADLHVGTPMLIDSTLGNSYSIVHVPAGSIHPGSCDSVVVRFRPTTGGPKRGSVTIPTNARDYPTFTASLGGVGGVRTISQDTTRQAFADTVLCGSSSKCFVISNLGTLPLRVDSVVLDGAGKTEFTVSNPLGATIAPGAKDTLCVTHAATVFGTSNANLIVYSNALNLPADTLSLIGLGRQAFMSFSPRRITQTIPCRQTYDTTIFMRDTGNITAHVTPQIGNLPAGWKLILPFQQDVDSSGSFRIRHGVSNTTRTDTLNLVLTWNNKGNCGPARNDTLQFIYHVDCDTSAVREIGSVATEFALLQNYPNPFNPTTSIAYAIPTRAHVTLKVYNALGEVVSTLENSTMDAGIYHSTFDATNLPSGNYFYELTAGTYTKRMMMTLTK